MQFRPERGISHNWYVWCGAGAAEVLRNREYLNIQDDEYTISFANAAYTKIKPGDELWEALKAVIDDGFLVETFDLSMKGGYFPWTGDPDSMTDFDGIKIVRKTPCGS
jgi:hypothetical protein